MKKRTKKLVHKITSLLLSGTCSLGLLSSSVQAFSDTGYDAQNYTVISNDTQDAYSSYDSPSYNSSDYNNYSYSDNFISYSDDYNSGYSDNYSSGYSDNYSSDYNDYFPSSEFISEGDFTLPSEESEHAPTLESEENLSDSDELFSESEESITVDSMNLNNNDSFAIRSIVSDNNIITVKWSAPSIASLEVTVLDESDPTSLIKQSALIDTTDEDFSTQFVYETLPEYYYIHAVLIDTEGNELCDPFIERRYTEAVQALSNADYADFDTNLTVPLFTNEDGFTSFVVMTENAKVVYTEKHQVSYVESDGPSDQFFLTSDSDYVLGIEEGDVVAMVNDTDRQLYCGPITQLDPATGLPQNAPGSSYYEFNFFKVASVSSSENGIVLTAANSSAINPAELFQMVVVKSGNSTASDFSGTATVEKEVSFGYEEEGLSGEGTIKMDIEYELYIDFRGFILKEAYFSLRDDYRIENFTIRLKFAGEKSILLFELPLGEPGVLDLALKLKLVIQAEITGSISFNIVGTFGGSIGTREADYTEDPNFEFNKFELQGAVFIGIGISLAFDLLFFEFSVSFVPGIEVSGALSAGEEGSSTTPWHLCNAMECLQGEIQSKLNFVLSADFKFKEFSKTFPLFPKKITDYYWSWTYDTHDWTECPYKGYQLNVTVLSQDTRQPVSDVDVTYTPLDVMYKKKGSGTTSEEGKVTMYVPADEANAIAVSAEKTLPGGTEASNIYRLIKTEEAQDIEILLNTTENYNICFDANKPGKASHDPTGEMQKIQAVYGTDQVLPGNAFALTGWTFAGWSTQADGKGIYITEEGILTDKIRKDLGIKPGDDLTLYATWTPREYKITYEYVLDGETKTYERSYYYDNETGLYNYDYDSKKIWRRIGIFGGPSYETGKTYSNLCYFDPDGNLVGYHLIGREFEQVEMNVAVLLDESTPITGIADQIGLYKDGTTYSHAGMFVEKPDTPGEYSMVETVDGAFEYGDYEILIKVGDTYTHTGQNLTIGKNSPKVTLNYYSVNVTDDQNAGAANRHLNEKAIPGPLANTMMAGGSIHISVNNSKLREGTIFDHWEISESVPSDFIKTIAEQDVDIIGKTTIVAATRPIQYSIVFEANKPAAAASEITGTMTPAQTEYGVSMELPLNAYQLTGWTFQYWTSEDDGTGSVYENGEAVENMTETDGATRTLYAQWKQNTYSISFDANKPAIAEQSVTGSMDTFTDIWYESALELPLNTYVLNGGWKFTGWNTKADGSGVAFSDGDIVTQLTAENNASVVLYAQWKADEYVFTDGMNSEWQKGSETALRFKTNGPLESLRTLLIDNKEVDKKSYKLTSGSTVIDLEAAFLEKLKDGKHTITARYENGSAPDTVFTVKISNEDPDDPDDPNKPDNPNKPGNDPKYGFSGSGSAGIQTTPGSETPKADPANTGDPTRLLPIAALLLLSLIIIIVLIILLKRKNGRR